MFPMKINSLVELHLLSAQLCPIASSQYFSAHMMEVINLYLKNTVLRLAP